jgi:hypothetical protein
MRGNPFNWHSAAPPFVILRPEVGGLVEDVRRGQLQQAGWAPFRRRGEPQVRRRIPAIWD